MHSLWDKQMECERQQTLKWLEHVPRNKLNSKNMVMVISSGGIPKFVPLHLLEDKKESDVSEDTMGSQ